MALALSIAAGSLSAQSTERKRRRAHRIFAAQTGPDQVTLVWDEVPGATEYRIYLASPEMSGPPPLTTRPTITMSGSSRQAYVRGVQRLANGGHLVAMAAGQVLFQGTFNAVTRGPVTPVAAPASVQAQETGATEVTVSWDAVPGATAYSIGRSVAPEGLRMACQLCPPINEYVDTAAVPGVRHFYTVQAVFPTGISARTGSNRFVMGAAPVAAAPPATQPTTGLPTAPTTPTGNPGAATPSGATSTPTPWTPPGIPAGATQTATPATPSGTPQPASDSVPTLVNPHIPLTVPDTTPPPIGPTPSDAGSLATPPADTGSCVNARAEPVPADTLERIDTRDIRIDLRNNPNPDASLDSWAAVTTTNRGSPDYRQGKCLNPGATGYPDLWDPIAAASGLTSAERVAAWKEIGIIALEYKHILGRQPTPEETRRDVAALKAGTTWWQLWRQLAHSAERDARFGYWAPAPITDSLEAQRAFGLKVPPWTAQQCYGGLGPKCGGLPDAINALNDKVYRTWFGAFRLPDNTEFAYIDMGVAVGSILHDGACLADKGGLNCDGVWGGELFKLGGLWAAELEWNKAAWNVIDGRTWRARFGPYPTNLAFRDRYWYDDLRPATTRPAMMARAISVLSWPGLTVTYTGGETRQSRALLAPAGTSLDATDVAFCRSGTFASTGWFVGKAPWGICAEGTSSTPTASPPTTGTPTTGTPTTGTPTTGTPAPSGSCKLEYQRADNMWAAAGRPDGFLGVESITLAAGEHQVFITDWKYEKQRNNGTTYYGSHLRIATNASSRAIRLQLISGAGAITSTERLPPNTTLPLLQADLRDVYCEP